MLNQNIRQVLAQQGLSNRESEVAALIATGLSNKEAADKLFVTEKTVKFHLTNIYKKMNIRSRAQLIVWCLPHLRFEESAASSPNNVAQIRPAQEARPVQNQAAVPARVEPQNTASNVSPITQLTPGRYDGGGYGGSDIGMGGGAFGT